MTDENSDAREPIGLSKAPDSNNTKSAYRPKRAWFAIAVLMLFQMSALVDRQILTLMFIEVRADLGLSDFQISLFQGLALTGFYCLAALFAGTLADRLSIRRIIFASVALWSVAAAACGIAKSYWGMMIARMAMGAGQGAMNPAAQVLISSSFPRDRVSLPMSLFTLAGSMGMGLAYFGGGLLLEMITARSVPGLESFAPWRQVVIVTALPGLALAFLAFAFFEPKIVRAQPGATSWHELRLFLASERRLFFRLALSFGLILILNYSVFSWAPTYGRRVLNLSPSVVGTEMGIISTICGIIAGAMFGYVIDKQFARGKHAFFLRVFSIGTIVALPISIAGFLLDQHAAFLAALLAVQCILAATFGSAIAAVQMVTPANMRGKMGGLIVVFANFIGFALGPMLVGALTDFLFRDPQKIGWSIALVAAVLGPISAWFAWTAQPYYVARIKEIGASP